jgi:hypothetical protein
VDVPKRMTAHTPEILDTARPQCFQWAGWGLMMMDGLGFVGRRKSRVARRKRNGSIQGGEVDEVLGMSKMLRLSQKNRISVFLWEPDFLWALWCPGAGQAGPI